MRTSEKGNSKAEGKIFYNRSHSFATHFPEQGTNLRYIQELLGHSSPKATRIYTRVASNALTKIRNPLDTNLT